MDKIRSGRALKPKEEIESEFEQIAARSMVFAGLDFEVGGTIFNFPLQKRHKVVEATFRPDFKLTGVVTPEGELMGATIEGKRVFIEYHGSKYFDDRFVGKLYAFMQSDHHRDNYLVLAVDKRDTQRIDYALRGRDLKKEDISDRFWYLDMWDESGILLPEKQRYAEHIRHLVELKRDLDETKIAQLIRA